MVNDTLKMIAQLKEQLAQIERGLSAPTSTHARTQDAVVELLRSGPLPMPEIQDRLGITKSAAHTAVNALNTDGKVWVQKWPVPGKRGRYVFRVWLADQIVT